MRGEKVARKGIEDGLRRADEGRPYNMRDSKLVRGHRASARPYLMGIRILRFLPTHHSSSALKVVYPS